MRRTRRTGLTAGLVAALALGAALPIMAQEKQKQQEGDFPVGPPGGRQNVARHHGDTSQPIDREVNPSAINLPPGYRIEAVATGLNFPTDITFGRNGEMYVSEAGGHFYGTDPAAAPPPRILQIMPDGSKRVVYDNAVSIEAIRAARTYEEIPEGLFGPMEGITYNPNNGLIYIAHRTRYSTLNPQTGEFRTILDNLPAWGIFHNTKPAIDPRTGQIVFSVSSQGNAGPVDFAIMKNIAFYNKPDRHEIPCEDVTLTGKNFPVHNGFTPQEGDSAMTGAFVPFGVTTQPGQTIQGQLICNSAVYRMDPDGRNLQLIAWGVRNPFHHAHSPAGRLIMTNNSGNAIPPRRIFDDWETIYEIKEGEWYGWPDYYSSVPITDPRFSKPEDPDYKGKPKPHEFLLTEETRSRLLKGRERPPEPLVRLEPHAAAQGFVFGRSDWGMDPENEIILAEFGTVQKFTTKGPNPPGYRVTRVNLRTGDVTPFISNKSGRPASASKGTGDQSGGLERPLRMAWGPDGALYLVDFGVFDTYPKEKTSYGSTGVIWRVTRTGDAPMRRERIPVRKGGR
jgi:glucose/arabinose dehydrogenase